MSDTMIETEVLIIGAGPTGLMAANQLARFGVDSIIADSKSGPTIESRAIAVTARSLEIYQQMGLSDEVIENGQKIIEAQIFNKGKAAAKIEIGELGKGLSEFSYLLAYEQSKNESLLVRNLEDKGRNVLWQHEYKKLIERENGIQAILENTINGERLQVNARYLIACDGASSPVRHELDFSFEGGTYGHKFFVVDTVIDWPEYQNRVVMVPGENNFFGFLPLKGNNSFRIVGTLPLSLSESEDIAFEDIEDLVKETIQVDLKFEKVNWFSIYKLHHRMVDSFRKGNVFLAGDAAHIHSPAGGQGMNTGLQDAYNLCWKLALVLRGQADESLLDTYEEERLPFARFLLRSTDRAFTTATSRNWFVKMFRKYALGILAPHFGKIAGARPFVFRIISQTAWSYDKFSLSRNSSKQKLSFKAGDRFPYLKEDSIYRALNKPGYHVVYIGDSPLSEEKKQALAAEYSFPVYWIEQKMNRAWLDLGVKHPLLILVRPDNYIQSVSDI